MVAAKMAGLDVSAIELEAHALAGGDPRGVVQALIAARHEGLDMPFEAAARFDLAGRDPLREVEKEPARRRGAVWSRRGGPAPAEHQRLRGTSPWIRFS